MNKAGMLNIPRAGKKLAGMVGGSELPKPPGYKEPKPKSPPKAKAPKAVKEPNGTTLLDNVMVVYGSGNGDGNRHNHDDLPILLVGKGSDSIESGRHVVYGRRPEIPLTNLFLALFERMGAPAKAFGDSTGVLKI